MSHQERAMPCPAPRGVLGIIGGMGPAATADFLAKFTQLTPAGYDQEHIASVTCCFPSIPDRSEAILANGPSPLPAMLWSLKLLERCEVSRVVMPCNTAHRWFDDLQRTTTLPMIHIVDAVRHALIARDVVHNPVGLLATTATIRAGIYANRLAPCGIDCLIPTDDEQNHVMEVIRRIKARTVDEHCIVSIRAVAANLRRRGARSIILGCTELPLVLPSEQGELLDSTAALARECVLRCSSSHLGNIS